MRCICSKRTNQVLKEWRIRQKQWRGCHLPHNIFLKWAIDAKYFLKRPSGAKPQGEGKKGSTQYCDHFLKEKTLKAFLLPVEKVPVLALPDLSVFYRDKEAASPGATAAWAAAALGCPSPLRAGAGTGLLPPSLPLLPPARGTCKSNRCPHLACLPFCMPKPCWRTRQQFCPPVKMTSPVTLLMTIERKKEMAASKSQVFHLKICKSLLPTPFLLRLQLDTQLSFLSEGSISLSFTVSCTFSQ